MQRLLPVPGRRAAVMLPTPTEQEEQRVVAQWLDLHGILWTHPPLGGYRRRIEAAILHGLGARSGVPDVLIFDRPPLHPEYVGTAIELKRRNGGRPTTSQKEWLENLRKRGWYTAVCWGSGEAIDLLERLGYGKCSRKGVAM